MRSLFVALGLLVADTAHAELKKIAVMPAQLDKSAAEVPAIVNEYALAAVQALRRFDVVGQDDLEAVLGFEKQKELLGCDQTTCFAEIGGALGVDGLVSLKVAKAGKAWALSSKLIDVKQGTPKVLARATDFIQGDAQALLAALTPHIRKLFEGGDNAAAAVVAPAPQPAPAPVVTAPTPITPAPPAPARPPSPPPAPADTSELAQRLRSNLRVFVDRGMVRLVASGNRLCAVATTAGVFTTGKARLTDDGTLFIDAVARSVAGSTSPLSIDAHTDNAGSDDANLRLSQQRADAVRARLITQGASADAVQAVGRGETMPIAPNSNEQGRASNRRIEICVVGG